MFLIIHTIRRITDRHAGTMLLTGLIAIAWHNWRRWRSAQGSLGKKVDAPPSTYEMWPEHPLVSVLVAAWNEAHNIERHIRSFLDLRYPNKELILCAGGEDGTAELARRWSGPGVTVLDQRPGEGKQAALRRCLKHAQGSIIYLTDADCEFSEDAFSRLIEPLTTGDALVTTGGSEPKLEQRSDPFVQYQWFRDLARTHSLPETVDGVLGRNCALQRHVLEEIGGFEQPVATGTDYSMSRRLTQAGYPIRHVALSSVATEYPDTPAVYLRTWRRWNKNLLIHGPRFGAWGDVRGVLVAFVLYGLILLLPVLIPLLGPIALTGSLLLLTTAITNRLRRSLVGARIIGARLSPDYLLQLPFYTGLDLLAVFGAVWDTLDPRRRSRW